ncbi:MULTISPECIES: aldo/keto reductase [unclassified Shimia]|uniref:aldo/keto reductase n=1 Tax=unclassified Shimia TaxID=2630038 RepID=UPI003108AD20
MQYAKLGKSNLTVSRLTLGTMTFGPRTSESEAHRILDQAVDMGINLIDTSNDYGNPIWGQTETIVGNWIAKSASNRDRIVLATKVFQEKPEPRLPNEEAGLSAYKIRKQVEESLTRLKTDHIDLYQVHHVDRRITGEELWGTFSRLQDAGKITYVGSSNYNGWALAKHQMQAQHRGALGFVSEQSMYSLLCRYPELDLIPGAQDLGIGLLAYMSLAGGLLASGNRHADGSRAKTVMEWYGLDEDDFGPRLDAYHALCSDLGVSGNTLATAWALSNPAVASAIVGIRVPEQFSGLPEAVEMKLSSETLSRLDQLFPISSGKTLKNAPSPEAYAW